nr:transposase, MuDR [Tanacetum cinerariifolium]
VNPTIYDSCIKQFWTFVSIKKTNDVVRLQALIDRKKVIITEDTIRQALRLDDAAGVDCLPNKDIFVELARMGYEKLSTKLTFYKAFFSAQWKFLIHTILQCISEKRTAWNEFSSSMASAVICLATVDDLSAHTTKYTSPAFTQKVFANMRRIGKGFSGVNTPLFDGMLVQQVRDVEDAAEDEDDDNEVREEETIQIFKTKEIKEGGKIAELDADEDVTLVDAKEDRNADVQRRLAESQAKVYHMDLQHAEKVLSMQDTDEAEPAEVEEVIEVVTAANAPKRRRGVVIQDPKETATASVIVHSETIGPELNANINRNDVLEQVKRKEKQDNTVMRYQALKRKPVTEAQARKNMMVYLKNMAGFKMDFFKGMTYNDIRPIFEKHYNLNQAFLERVKEEVIGQKEEGNKRKDDSASRKEIPFARFTLEQMLNNVRLEVKEESEMSLKLLRVILKTVSYSYYYQYKVVSAIQLVSAASIVVNTVSGDYLNYFSLKIHHESYLSNSPDRKYKDGTFNYFNQVDVDLFSIVDLNNMLEIFSYKNRNAIHYQYKITDRNLYIRLKALRNDQDVLNLINHTTKYQLIEIYYVHKNIDLKVVIEEITPKKGNRDLVKKRTPIKSNRLPLLLIGDESKANTSILYNVGN